MLYSKKHIYLRSPLRISFVGGGTDLESYYSQGTAGHVVSATINSYVYVALKDMFDANVRVHHSHIETESIASRISHDYSKTALEYFGLFRGTEVVLTSDVMTTGSGLGASSSMMSALIVGCKELNQITQSSKTELAELTYELEKQAGTVGGKQDQYATVFGGLNSMIFEKDRVNVHPVKIKNNKLKDLESRLFLVYTNLARSSKTIQQQLTTNSKDDDKKKYLDDLHKLSRDFLNELESQSPDINSIGKILHEGWMLKKASNHSSTNPYIDQLYENLRNKGVIGGKILGAGGGGFFLALAENHETKEKIKYELYPNFIAIDISFTNKGTEILWKNF